MASFLKTFTSKTFAADVFSASVFGGGGSSGAPSVPVGSGSTREVEGYRKEICVTDNNGRDLPYFGDSDWNALRVLVASSTTTNLQIFGGSVGGSAINLAAVRCSTGIVVIADPNNSGTIYVGSDITVTANAGAVTSGIPLTKGTASPTIPVTSSDAVWLIGSGSGQNYTVLCV